ncbi:SDR family NAD(P)-dependent oxidoreductase [Rhodococcus hoagii]|nr:SDR family NAD(P)-dependent oxidoreductase [Prescottella equi]
MPATIKSPSPSLPKRSRPRPAQGQKIVVTAAAGTGIGFSTARRALLEGADVLVSTSTSVVSVNRREAVGRVRQQQVESFVCDVSSTEQVDALIVRRCGEAGPHRRSGQQCRPGRRDPDRRLTDEQWDRVVDITLTSTFRATRARCVTSRRPRTAASS